MGPQKVCGAKPRKKLDPEVMGPRRVGPQGWGPERVGAQNFALFSVSRSQFRSLCLSLCVFSWFFGGVWKCRGRQMFTSGVLGLSCEAPAARSRRGFTQQRKPPKFNEKTPRERHKERKWRRETEKTRNFGRSGGGEVRQKGVPIPTTTTNTNHNNNHQQHTKKTTTDNKTHNNNTQHTQQQLQQHKQVKKQTTQNNTNTHTNNNPHQHQPQHNTRTWIGPKWIGPNWLNHQLTFNFGQKWIGQVTSGVCSSIHLPQSGQ